MNILYLAHRIPYPPNKGDKIRSFQVVNYLSQLGDLYLAALVDDPDDLHYGLELRKFCKEISLTKISKTKKKLFWAKAFYKRLPLSIYYFYEESLQRAVNAFLSACPFDVIFCFSSPMAEYIFRSDLMMDRDQAAVPLLIMDFCDLDSAKWAAYAELSRWPLSLIYRRESRFLSNYERRVAEAFDYTVFVSDREKSLFDCLNPDYDTTLVISNGVDLDFFFPQHPDGSEPSGTEIVFTGAMDYYANVDGVCWFAERIWPRILEEFPAAHFLIVGSNPHTKIKRLNDRMNIQVTGYVKDIRPYYNRATLCVVPLRVARGLQNKVLEAMAMKKAVVCTPNAFDGIRAEPGRDLMVANDENTFAATVVQLLKDEKMRHTLGENGRLFIQEHHSWNTVLPLWRELIARKI